MARCHSNQGHDDVRHSRGARRQARGLDGKGHEQYQPPNVNQ
ncbi:hypothetical protein [Nostoc sp.]